MRFASSVTVIVLLAAAAGLASAQYAEPAAVGLSEIRQGWPDDLVIHVTGLFESAADGQVAMGTWAPLEDESVVDDWYLIEGASYEFEVALHSDGGWLLRSLSCAFSTEEPVTALPPFPVPELALRGSFVAPHEGRLFPQFTAEGESELDCTVRLLVLPVPGIMPVLPAPAPTTVIHIEESRPVVRTLWWPEPYNYDFRWSWPSPPHRHCVEPPTGPRFEREAPRRQIDRPSPPPSRREGPRYVTISPSPTRPAPEKPRDRAGDDHRRSDPPQAERADKPASRTRGRPGHG